MAEMFRLKIRDNGSVILPVRLIIRLKAEIGDEMRVVINDDNSLQVTFEKGSEAYAPSGEDLKELRVREKKMADKADFGRILKRLGQRRSASSQSAQGY
jgi:bifunctional DNA-binding transcriptional regulator/antitoxin component of YhaV-PrlF toxin-antitoxin module